ncbi:MAG: DNA polymerase III subunit alpha, partial [Sphingomonadaceae bacterium]
TYAALCAQPAPADGGRTGAVMAVLVEDVRWRTSARGRRYANCAMSDATGQFIASCFDELTAKDLEEAAKDNSCGLLTVELDRQPGEETPRITVKRIQPMEGLQANARLKAVVRTSDIKALMNLAQLLEAAGNGRGEVILDAPLDGGQTATIRLGRNFALDAELAARIEAMEGIEAVTLSAADSPRLALVS